MGLTNKMEQGNIKALFPNLGKTVWKDGQDCEIIGCNGNELQLRVLTEGGFRKVGCIFWADCFLYSPETWMKIPFGGL